MCDLLSPMRSTPGEVDLIAVRGGKITSQTLLKPALDDHGPVSDHMYLKVDVITEDDLLDYYSGESQRI